MNVFRAPLFSECLIGNVRGLEKSIWAPRCWQRKLPVQSLEPANFAKVDGAHGPIDGVSPLECDNVGGGRNHVFATYSQGGNKQSGDGPPRASRTVFVLPPRHKPQQALASAPAGTKGRQRMPLSQQA